MAFEGWLLKIGTYTFPMEYIAEETYQVVPQQRQELDAYRDNLGVLHREVAENRPGVVGFSTFDGLTNADVREIFRQIYANYENEAERKVKVVYYIPETDSYSEPEEMYIPNIGFPIDSISGNTVVYNSISFSFIGY